MNRYSRQVVLEKIGEEGQDKISNAEVLVIGAGALGSTISEGLTRAGVGKITVVDRDFVELSNLQRQTLYEEDDIGKAKAEVAVEHLQKINSDITLEYEVIDVSSNNIERLVKGKDIVLDGTDNLKTRFIINDACVKHNIPWIYSAVLQTYGMNLNILPNDGPCLRCMIDSLPTPDSMETCATAGVLFSIPRIIGDIASTEAVKYIVTDDFRRTLLTFDVWDNEHQYIQISQREDCDCCVKKNFSYLESEEDLTTVLCGKNAVQVSPSEERNLDLDKIVERYPDSKKVGKTMLKLTIDEYELNLFKDGRLIVKGTENLKKARSLYSEYIGG